MRTHIQGDSRILKRAVACLTRAEKFNKCVDLLVSRGRTRHALKLLHEHKKYEAALDLVQAHPSLKDYAPPHDLCYSHLLELCANGHAVAAKNNKRSESSRKQSMEKFKETIKQMSADDEERQLLAHGYKEQLSERLVQRGNFSKAARMLGDDEKREEAAHILCDTNPSPVFSDFAFGIELLLAHALCADASADQKLHLVTKAQKLQLRMHNLSDCSDSQLQTQLSLDLFLAHITDAGDKQERLNKVDVSVDSRSSPQNQNELARTLCSIALSSLKQIPDVMETHAVVNKIDAILNIVDSKDGNTLSLQYLRCEQFFDIRRTDGSVTISRPRKAMMDSMLNMHEPPSDDKKPIFNPEGDIIIDHLRFKSALSQYLLSMRHRILVKFLAEMSNTLAQQNIAVSERLTKLLLSIWGVSMANKKKLHADKSERQLVNIGDWVKLSKLTGMDKRYNGEEALVQKIDDVPSAHSFTVRLIHAGGQAENNLSGLKAENFRHVDPLSKKNLSDLCARVEACLAGECLCIEQRVVKALPLFSKYDVEVVYVQLQNWIWDAFGHWSRSPMSNRSERSLSGMLLVFERMDQPFKAARLLSTVDHDCRQRGEGMHSFLNLVHAQQFAQSGFVQMQALSMMRHLHAHTPTRVISDDVLQSRDTNSLRLVLRALVLSLVDLRRLHIQTAAERIKWTSLTTAVLLPSSFALTIASLKFADDKTLTGVETLILALQNLAAILTVYENSSHESRARAMLSSNTVDQILSVVALISLNYVVAHSRTFAGAWQPCTRWSQLSSQNWATVNALIVKIFEYLCKGKHPLKMETCHLPCGELSCADPASLLSFLQKQRNPLVLLKVSSAGFKLDKSAPSSHTLSAWISEGLKILHNTPIVSSTSLQAKENSPQQDSDKSPSEPAKFAGELSEPSVSTSDTHVSATGAANFATELNEPVSTSDTNTIPTKLKLKKELSANVQNFVPMDECSPDFELALHQADLDAKRETKSVAMIQRAFRAALQRFRGKEERRRNAFNPTVTPDTTSNTSHLEQNHLQLQDRYQRRGMLILLFIIIQACTFCCDFSVVGERRKFLSPRIFSSWIYICTYINFVLLILISLPHSTVFLLVRIY